MKQFLKISLLALALSFQLTSSVLAQNPVGYLRQMLRSGRAVIATRVDSYAEMVSQQSQGNPKQFIVENDENSGLGETIYYWDGFKSRMVSFNGADVSMLSKTTPFLTISELRSGRASTSNVVYVTDGGRSGSFIYQPGSVATDDSSMVIVSSGRRYVRDYKTSEPVKAEWFGLAGDNSAADSLKFLGILAKGYRNVQLGEGTFRIGVTISQSNVKISGVKPQWNGASLTGGTIINGRIVITGNNNQISNLGITNTTSDGILIRDNASNNVIDNVATKVFNHGYLIEQYGGAAKGNTVRNSQAYGGIHGFVSKSANCTFEKCLTDGASQDGFVFVTDNITGSGANSVCVNNRLIASTVLNTNIGINIYSRDYFSTTNTAGIELEDLVLDGNVVDNVASYGISVGDAQATPGGQTYNKARQITITNNVVKNATTWGIQFARCNSVSVGNNVIDKAMNKTTDAEKVMVAPNASKVGSFGNLVYNSILTVNSTTPSLLNGETYFETNNTATTNITNFTGGRVGQVIWVYINDDFTTILNNSNITLKNYVKGIGSVVVLKFYNDATKWVELFSYSTSARQDWPYAATLNLDYRNGRLMTTFLSGDVTAINFTNMPKNTEPFTLVIQASSVRNLSGWDSRIVWLNNKVPRIATSNSRRVYTFYFDGTNIINVGRQGEELNNSITYTPGTIAAGSKVSTTITVNGAEMTDMVQTRFSNDLQGAIINSYVSAPNTVAVDIIAPAGAGVTLAQGTLLTTVFPH